MIRKMDTKNFHTYSTFHLQLCNSELILELMITEGNKQKGQSLNDPALIFTLGLLFRQSKFPLTYKEAVKEGLFSLPYGRKICRRKMG